MKVEQALRLIPDLEALAPLRSLLLSASHADERARWASASPYLTVGKRGVEAEDLRERLEELLHQISTHLRELYGAVVEAIEAQGRGEAVAAIAALRRAGGLEVAVGRFTQAQVWYESALELAVELSDRGAELELLRVLAALCRTLGRYQDAARNCQRSLALAEAELNPAAVVAACEELGNISRDMGQLAGAQAWYERGLGLNGTGGSRTGWLLLRLGDLARGRGDHEAAGQLLERARAHMESGSDAAGMAQTLSALGQVQVAHGQLTVAFASYREALAWARRGPEPANLEVDIRLRLAELAMESGRWLEAEADLRQAEQAALAHRIPHRLVDVYTGLGRLSARGGEETGFVFFEQSLALCRALKLDPALAAEVLVAYAQFHSGLGNGEAARSYLERALEVYETTGQSVALERARTELARLAPPRTTPPSGIELPAVQGRSR